MNSNIAVERAVLAGVFTYGHKCLADISDIINEKTFFEDSNKCIYKCVDYAMQKNPLLSSVDLPTFLSAASALGLDQFFNQKSEFEHLKSVKNCPIEFASVRPLAEKIKKLEVARDFCNAQFEAQCKLKEITGDESIGEIIAVAENPIFQVTSSLSNREGKPELMGFNIDEYLEDLESEENQQSGISSGFPRYDHYLGGGFRGGSINLIGARSGKGKSVIAANICHYTAKHLKVPTLYLDTEMKKEDQLTRMMAMKTSIEINDIENGSFRDDPIQKGLLKEAAKDLKDIPLFHKSIAGFEAEQQLAVIRQWLVQEVGLDNNGHANKCLICLDYLKLMNARDVANMQEYQVFGFIMSNLHDFAIRYDIPILALVQLNRDGVNRESADVISQSDRILWLCSNLAIFKDKDDEEVALDGFKAGNKKMLILKSRFGPETASGEYINYTMTGKYAQVTEGKTNLELKGKDIQLPSNLDKMMV